MKKVLAWAVVLALVLSSFTMAFAGEGAKTTKDFKDASEIQYTEAVDVMAATGIINGFPDGTFGPQKTVTRGQMAKMIACIMNGGEDVGDQYKDTCSFADSKTHWAAGYIAYCANEHIIDGRSADVFDPDADVTGTEVAKMALTSLGYDSKIQGYTGDTWATAVLRDAKKNNLFDGLKDFTPKDPCSREAAAQILFNMLKTQEVEYKTSLDVQGDSVTVDSEVARGDEMYKDVFDGDLVEKVNHQGSTDGRDEYGRPGHAWEYQEEEIGTYTDAPEYEFTAEGETSIYAALEAYDEDVYNDFNGAEATKSIKNVYVNGVVRGTGQASVARGDKVELYNIGDDQYRAIVVQYKPWLITKVSTAVNKTDAKNGVAAYIYGQQDNEEIRWFDTELIGYDEETYVEGAVIAVSQKNDRTQQILDSYVLEEAAAGAVEKVTIDPSFAFTIDKKKYEVTDSFVEVDGNDVVINEEATYTFYDYNGYLIASVQDQEPAPEYSYGIWTAYGVKAEANTYSQGSTYTYFMKVFTSEGEEKEFTVSEKLLETYPNKVYTFWGQTILPRETFTAQQARLIAYQLNEAGEIDFYAEGQACRLNAAKMGLEYTLEGKFVSKDVAAFANIGTSAAPEWKVYGIDDLNAKDAEITARSCFYEGDPTAANGETYVAFKLDENLEPVSVPDVDYGFISKRTEIAYNGQTVQSVEAFLNGETDLRTFVDVNMTGLDPTELYTFTTDADGKVTIAPAGVQPASGPVDAVGTSSESISLGENNFQSVEGATIYYLNQDLELEVSSFEGIQMVNNPFVYMYQTEAGATGYNLVVFTDIDTGSNVD